VSEIRYVERLGDAIESAAARRIASRRGRLRRVFAGVVGIALIGTSVATATSIFGDSGRLAAGGVYCFDAASLDSGGTGIVPDGRSPVAACAAETGRPEPHVACDAGDAVAVVPGRSPATCERLGLAALPADYEAARKRVRALARDIRALEAEAGCVPPEEMASRVQALLDRSGWAGWRTWLRTDVSDGPCGSVAALNGDGSTSIEPSIDVNGRRVMVFGGAG
jgi:hypothetical protein